MTEEEREDLLVKLKMAQKAAHISAAAHPEFWSTYFIWQKKEKLSSLWLFS